MYNRRVREYLQFIVLVLLMIYIQNCGRDCSLAEIAKNTRPVAVAR